MPRPRPPHLHHERTRHGTLVWYVRVGKGPRIRIKAAYGTPAFQEDYQAALTGERPAAPKFSASGSLRWLLERYRETQDWTRLSLATRRQRENIFRPVIEQHGEKAFRLVTARTIKGGLDRRAATPFGAKNYLDAMRGLFRWAAAAQHIQVDPTAGIKAHKPKTEGFPVWTEEDAARFEARWPIGSRERLAFDIAIYTGLRRGDIAQLGRQHVREGIITMRTGKTGEIVVLPVLPELAASIAAAPTGTLSFVATAAGKPMVKEGFGNWFREACDTAGVKKSLHGLRKLGATRAADRGASEAQLEAIFGWRGGGMAALYTKAANRRRLAKEAMEKMGRPEQPENIYSRTLMTGAGVKAKN